MQVKPHLPLAELKRLERCEKDADRVRRLRIVILSFGRLDGTGGGGWPFATHLSELGSSLQRFGELPYSMLKR